MTLKERIGSPFLSAFIVSWLIWNYRALMVAFSIQSVKNNDKFAWFDGFYSSPENWGHLIILPFWTALAFIFVYPFFAILPFWFTHKRIKIFKNIKTKFEDGTALSEKESIDLKRQLREQAPSYERVIKELKDEKNVLEISLAEKEGLENDIEQARRLLDEREKHFESINKKQNSEISELQKILEDERKILKESEKITKDLQKEKNVLEKQLRGYKKRNDTSKTDLVLNDDLLNILYIIGSNYEDYAYKNNILNRTKLSVVKAKVALRELENHGYIYYNDNDLYSIQPKGLQAIKDFTPSLDDLDDEIPF